MLQTRVSCCKIDNFVEGSTLVCAWLEILGVLQAENRGENGKLLKTKESKLATARVTRQVRTDEPRTVNSLVRTGSGHLVGLDRNATIYTNYRVFGSRQIHPTCSYIIRL